MEDGVTYFELRETNDGWVRFWAYGKGKPGQCVLSLKPGKTSVLPLISQRDADNLGLTLNANGELATR